MSRNLWLVVLMMPLFFAPRFVLAEVGDDGDLEEYLDQVYETGDFNEEDFDDFERLMYLARPEFQITGDDTSSEDNSSSDDSSTSDNSTDSSSSDSSTDSSTSTTEGAPALICRLHPRAGVSVNQGLVFLILFAGYLMIMIKLKKRNPHKIPLLLFLLAVIFLMTNPATAGVLGKRQFESAANVSYQPPSDSHSQPYPALHFPQIKLKKNYYMKPNMGLIVQAHSGNIITYLQKIDEQAEAYYKIYNHFIEQVYTTNAGVKGVKYSYDHLGAVRDVLRTNGYVIKSPQNLYITLVCTYLSSQQQLESVCDQSAQTVRFHPE